MKARKASAVALFLASLLSMAGWGGVMLCFLGLGVDVNGYGLFIPGAIVGIVIRFLPLAMRWFCIGTPTTLCFTCIFDYLNGPSEMALAVAGGVIAASVAVCFASRDGPQRSDGTIEGGAT